MKRLGQIIFLSFFALFPAQSYSQNLSDDAKISLITCGAGNELYSIFGHSAIRVCDSSKNIDFVFNYGTFDFSTKNFYLKFASGTLIYQLSCYDFSYFIDAYGKERRSVFEQELNISVEQKNKLFSLLIDNFKPQNRSYRYDFFKDNCSTRIRDVFKRALGEKLVFPENNIDKKTFRQYIYPYLENWDWSKFGIDILLGMPTDVVAKSFETMFLPEELKLCASATTIAGKPFVKSEIMLLPQQTKTDNKKLFLTPGILFFSLFIIVLLFSVVEFFTPHKVIKIFLWVFDRLFFLVCALLSLVIILMWTFSLHYPVSYNMNIFWLNPLLFYIALRLNKSKLWILIFCILCDIFSLTQLMPQHLNSAFIPIIFILLIRLFSAVLRNNKFHFSKF